MASTETIFTSFFGSSLAVLLKQEKSTCHEPPAINLHLGKRHPENTGGEGTNTSASLSDAVKLVLVAEPCPGPAARPTPSARSTCRPTAIGARRPSVRCENFRIGTERMPQPLIRALGIVKRAAAEVNHELGLLDARRATRHRRGRARGDRRQARRSLPARRLADRLRHADQHERQRGDREPRERAPRRQARREGAGASQRSCQHEPVVERLFPTAMHIAAAEEIAHQLMPALAHLQDALQERQGIRRHRQDRPHAPAGRDAADARPGILRLCGAGRERHRAHAARAEAALSAGAGRHRGRHRPQRQAAIRQSCSRRRIAEITRLPFVSAPNKFEALASHDAYVFAHGALNALATGLFKIANDIRLLGSGPRSGLGELILPENEPGSSIMPGKVNPTQAEALTMVCCQVFGNDTTITVGRAARAISSSTSSSRCWPIACCSRSGCWPTPRAPSPTTASPASAPTRRASDELMQRSLMLVTALAPKIGYDKAAEGRQGRPCQRHHAARGSGPARAMLRRGVRPPGAAGADGTTGLMRSFRADSHPVTVDCDGSSKLSTEQAKQAGLVFRRVLPVEMKFLQEFSHGEQ